MTRRAPKRAPSDIPTDGSALVTSIRLCTDEPDKATLRVDRVNMGRIERALLDRHHITEGTPWTEDLANTLAPILARTRALRAAIRLLSARDRSSAELRRALRQRKHDDEAITHAIERLTEFSMIDDARYARNRASAIVRTKAAGPRYIQAKLREKGLAQSHITPAVDEALEDIDLLESAIALATRAAATMPQSLDKDTRIRRISGRLARRGFDHDTVRKAVEHALGSLDD
jgi:regulatory protein